MTETNDKTPEVKTIGEVERIVHASGAWDGTSPVEFSNDGETWRETWSPTDEHPFPEFARVSVYRKDVRLPTTAVIRWDEQLPREDAFWLTKWTSSPMRHFGRTARMVAFRQTFRDLLGNIIIEDEDRADRTVTTTEPSAPERDWAADIDGAATQDALNAVEKEAREHRIFTPDATGTALHRRLKDRRRALAFEAWVPDAGTPPEPEEVTQMPEHADDVRRGDPRKPADYLPPANRAERRAKNRKKGRR